MPEQFGIECRHHVRGPPDALGLADQPAAHQLDEIGDVAVDHAVGAVGVIRRFGIGFHTAAGDPGRFETRQMVEGVEVAVGGVAGVTGLR